MFKIALFKYNFTVVSTSKTTDSTTTHQTRYVISTFAHVTLTWTLSCQGSWYGLHVGCMFLCMFLCMSPCILNIDIDRFNQQAGLLKLTNISTGA